MNRLSDHDLILALKTTLGCIAITTPADKARYDEAMEIYERWFRQPAEGIPRSPLGFKSVVIQADAKMKRAAFDYLAAFYDFPPDKVHGIPNALGTIWTLMVAQSPGVESSMGRALFEFEEYCSSASKEDIAEPTDRPAILNDAADLQLAVVELCHDFGLPLSEVMLKAVERKRSGEYKGKIDA